MEVGKANIDNAPDPDSGSSIPHEEQPPSSEEPQQVDIRSVLEAKNPSLYRILPDTVLRALERLVHARDINRTLRYIGGRIGIDFAEAVLEEFNTSVEARGVQRLQDVERPIIVSNHPLGGIDGVALIALFGRFFPGLLTPANDILMHLRGLRSALIPVNKHGSNAENIERYNQANANAEAILHFPAGLVSRKTGGRVRDLAWQKSFVVQARRHNRPVVPVFFDGKNSEFFYNLSLVRRKIHFPVNLEMLLLPSEMFKQRNQSFHATIGHPIPASHLTRDLRAAEWAERIRRHIYRLSVDPDAAFSPIETHAVESSPNGHGADI